MTTTCPLGDINRMGQINGLKTAPFLCLPSVDRSSIGPQSVATGRDLLDGVVWCIDTTAVLCPWIHHIKTHVRLSLCTSAPHSRQMPLTIWMHRLSKNQHLTHKLWGFSSELLMAFNKGMESFSGCEIFYPLVVVAPSIHSCLPADHLPSKWVNNTEKTKGLFIMLIMMLSKQMNSANRWIDC